MTFTSTNVTATAISTAAASSPSIATTAAGAAFSSAPSTSSGNSFSRNSSRRRSNSKSGSISTVCMLCWALTKGYGSGTLRKHSRSIVRITAERSIPDFWLAPICCDFNTFTHFDGYKLSVWVHPFAGYFDVHKSTRIMIRKGKGPKNLWLFHPGC